MRNPGRRLRESRRYVDDFARRAGRGYGREVVGWSGAPRSAAYGNRYRTSFRDRGGNDAYWRKRPRRRESRSFWGEPIHRPARGFPPHAVHTYDLDYGRQAGGPTTEYSGRAGYPVPEEYPEHWGEDYRAGIRRGGPPDWRGGAGFGRSGARTRYRGPGIRRRGPRTPPRHWSTAEPPRRGTAEPRRWGTAHPWRRGYGW